MGPTGAPGEDGQRVNASSFISQIPALSRDASPTYLFRSDVLHQLSPQAAAAGLRLGAGNEGSLCLTFSSYETTLTNSWLLVHSVMFAVV